MFGRDYSAIAVDAGTTSLALCQLLRSGSNVRLYQHRRVEDPLHEAPHAALPGSASRAARLVTQTAFRGRVADLALRPPDVAFHLANIPVDYDPAKQDEWQSLLRYDAARNLDCDPEMLEVDWWPLPPGNRTGNNVMTISAKRDTIENWQSYFAACGLTLRRIDVLPLTLLRAALRMGLPRATTPDRNNALWGILNVGCTSSLLTVVLGAHCVYVRSLAVSGGTFTSEISRSLDVDYRSAEALKRRIATDWEQSTEDELLGLGAGIVQQSVQGMAAEVQRAFQYAMEGYPEAVPTTIYVCGGGARLTPIVDWLSEALGVKVEAFNALECIEVAPGAVTPVPQTLSAVCVGLALGGIGV